MIESRLIQIGQLGKSCQGSFESSGDLHLGQEKRIGLLVKGEFPYLAKRELALKNKGIPGLVWLETAL